MKWIFKVYQCKQRHPDDAQHPSGPIRSYVGRISSYVIRQKPLMPVYAALNRPTAKLRLCQHDGHSCLNKIPAFARMTVLTFLVAFLFLPLTGCTTIAYNTYKAANNPLPIGTQIDDKLIYAKGSVVLMNYPGLKYTRNIHLLVFNKRMLIVGQVPSQKIRRGLVDKLARVQGLEKLYNYLTIGSSYKDANAKKDLLTEFKVTAAIFDHKGFNSYHYYFVVHRGVVYIFGESTQEKLKEASDMVSQVQGVRKVITFYSPKQSSAT